MKRMIVHCGVDSTQLALLQEGRLVEYASERSQKRGLVGSFFKGKVVNVIPGMQAAFVDIGQKKNAFLYIDDLLHPHLEKQPKQKPLISELLKPGNELIVQVVKEGIGNKGARVTTHFSLPGRWLVYMPTAGYIAVSKKIELEDERSRLKAIGDRITSEEEGLIIRTIAEHAGEAAIQEDLTLLRGQWKTIVDNSTKVASPCLLHQDLSMLQRLMRDVYSPETDEIVIDSRKEAKEIREFLSAMLPGKTLKIVLHKSHFPIFEHYGIKQQLDKDFLRKIWLPGGGYLVWDTTEALTVIDVNTGKFTGRDSLEDTVYLTNLEAAKEIARLVRLRDAGGIIIVDFIDMNNDEHRSGVLDTLESSFRDDRTQYHILGWTKLGLLEMTRKRMRNENEVVISSQ